MKTLVVGLGNPILGDDGVGWKIIQELRQMIEVPQDITIECQALGGISLMETLIDYDRAIIVDAINSKKTPIGSVRHYKLTDFPNTASEHMSSAHDTSLVNAIQLGQSLGANLPKDISVVTVEAQNVYEFSEDLTAAVAAAIPEAIRIILDLLLESKPDYWLKYKTYKV